MKVAFVGFRHDHVKTTYQVARQLEFVDIVACIEEDAAARAAIPSELGVSLTHETFEQALSSVEFDAVVCTDYFAKRGSLLLRALDANKHVFSDKPLCTTVEELREIARLSRERNRIVLTDLTMRYVASARALQALARSGAIGELDSAVILGVHGLHWGRRPGWYFEEGKHGGTLNDLAIHGLDMARWLTGAEFSHVLAASASSVSGSPAPASFQQSAQCLMAMANGARVQVECSYLAPGGHPSPWRFFLWGSEGHFYYEEPGRLELQRAGKPAEVITPDVNDGLSPFEDLARQVEFGDEAFLTPEECFRSTLASLTAQKAADERLSYLPVEPI